MIPTSYWPILRTLSNHNSQLGLIKRMRGIVYERCLELPLIVSRLQPFFHSRLEYLDIGSGDSLLPSFFLASTEWNVTVIDKHQWVQRQRQFASRVLAPEKWRRRLVIEEQNFLEWTPVQGQYDVITCVSVIEHFKGEMDTQAIKKIATLLKKGGLLLLTTPLNEGFPREFYLKARVYGEPYDGTPVFFQRHYDKNSLFARLVQPSGLRERERVFFGDYGLQAKELFMNIRWPAKPIKSLYQWAAPHLAKRFGSYSDAPVARPDMAMYTASGVFVILEKT